MRYFVGTRRKNMSKMRNLPVTQPVTMQAARDAMRPPREAMLKPSPAQVLSVMVEERVKRSSTWLKRYTFSMREQGGAYVDVTHDGYAEQR